MYISCANVVNYAIIIPLTVQDFKFTGDTLKSIWFQNMP